MRAWLESRLKELKPAGKTKTGLALALDLADSRVHEMISGKRSIKAEEIPAMARYLEMPVEQVFRLVGGRGAQIQPAPVAVAGYVGAGGEVAFSDDHEKGAGHEMIALPHAADGIVAVCVRGESQYPVYRDGEVILYARDGVPPGDLIGQECVVRLAEPDGRTLLKIVKRGPSPRTFTLASWNAVDIEGAKIEWAAPVLWIRRGG